MIRFVAGALGLVLLIGGGAAQEADKLQGEWKVIQAREGDKDNEELLKIKLVFKGDKITVTLDEAKTATFKLDPSRDPRHIDIKPEDGDKPLLGLYKLDGDKLTLCIAHEGQERPTEFKAKPGAKTVVLVLEKIK